MRFEDLGPGRAGGVAVTKVVVMRDSSELIFVGVGHISRRMLLGCLCGSYVAHFHSSIKTLYHTQAPSLQPALKINDHANGVHSQTVIESGRVVLSVLGQSNMLRLLKRGNCRIP